MQVYSSLQETFRLKSKINEYMQVEIFEQIQSMNFSIKHFNQIWSVDAHFRLIWQQTEFSLIQIHRKSLN